MPAWPGESLPTKTRFERLIPVAAEMALRIAFGVGFATNGLPRKLPGNDLIRSEHAEVVVGVRVR